MPKYLYIDFETQSPVDIKKAGVYPYVAHPFFRPACMAYGFTVDDIKIWKGDPEDFPCEIVTSNTLAVFNLEFERNVLNSNWSKRFLQLPDFSISQFTDVQAIGRIFGFPSSLDKLAKVLNVEYKKSGTGTHLINKLCKLKLPVIPQRYDPKYTAKFKQLDEYCMQDVRTTIACHQFFINKNLYDLSESEKQVYTHMIQQNDRGLPIDTENLNRIVQVLEEYKYSKNEYLSKLTDGEVTAGTQVAKLTKYLNVPDLTAGTVKELLADPNYSETKKKILRIRQAVSHSSTAKFKRLQSMVNIDGRIRGTLKYYGGHTGRFAGVGFQLHNLPRAQHKNPEEVFNDFKTLSGRELEEKYGNLGSAASKLIRPIIKTKPGHILCVADYVSIENVLLHWVAGDMKTVEDFRKGLDQYKVFASQRFNVKYDDVTSYQRTYSKPCVLGLGYGGGGGALQRVADGYGVNMDDETAEGDKRFYRNLYPQIPKLWHKVNDYMINCVKSKQTLTLNTETTIIRFIYHNQFAFIVLPSGRFLAYTLPRLEYDQKFDSYTMSYMGIDGYTKQWRRLGDINNGDMAIHGGRLVENIIQALARDLMVYGGLCAERAGYPIIGSVHDELISELDEQTVTSNTLNDFCKVICTLPAWAEGLPLRAEGYLSNRYRKE